MDIMDICPWLTLGGEGDNEGKGDGGGDGDGGARGADGWLLAGRRLGGGGWCWFAWSVVSRKLKLR